MHVVLQFFKYYYHIKFQVNMFNRWGVLEAIPPNYQDSDLKPVWSHHKICQKSTGPKCDQKSRIFIYFLISVLTNISSSSYSQNLNIANPENCTNNLYKKIRVSKSFSILVENVIKFSHSSSFPLISGKLFSIKFPHRITGVLTKISLYFLGDCYRLMYCNKSNILFVLTY
jgi:hypothetical protein